MKEQTLIEFITYLKTNPECFEKVKELGDDNAALAAYARELGYDFTPDDLSELKVKAQQLIGDKWRQLDESAMSDGAKQFMEFTKLAEVDNDIAKEVAGLSGNPQGLIEYGKEKGFVFNALDMKEVAKKLMEQEEELSDYELESVAGGITLTVLMVIGTVGLVAGVVGGAAAGAAVVGAVAVVTAVAGD